MLVVTVANNKNTMVVRYLLFKLFKLLPVDFWFNLLLDPTENLGETGSMVYSKWTIMLDYLDYSRTFFLCLLSVLSDFYGLSKSVYQNQLFILSENDVITILSYSGQFRGV